MTKYKIVEFMDGNGKILYRVQYKGWWRWCTVYVSDMDGDPIMYETDSIIKAKEKVRKLKSKQRKKLGDYHEDKPGTYEKRLR